MGIEHIVSTEEFVETFPGGLTHYQDYFKAKLLRKRRLSVEKIAEGIGRSALTVNGWLYEGRKPRCMRGLERLTGIIPLSKSSKKVVPIHRLYSWVFWSGSVGSNHAVTISGDKERLEMLKKYFQYSLRLKGEIKRRHARREACVLSFGDRGKLYGRVLRCLGYPIHGKKAEHKLSIPDSVLDSRQLKSDFIRVLINTRVKETNENYWNLYLVTTPYKRAGRDFASQIVGLMQEVFPLAGITESSIHLTPNKIDKYLPTIKFKRENLTRLVTNYPEQFVFKPRDIIYYQRK